jgi:preprotein translocase subunit SecG
MYTLIIVLLIIVAILICGIVLIQESKGGGLASGFSSANAALGVRKTTDFLEKTTWTLAAILIVLCVLSSKFAESANKDTNINTKAPVAAPAPTQQNPLSVGDNQNQPANAESAPANTEATPNQESAPAEPAPASEQPSK